MRKIFLSTFLCIFFYVGAFSQEALTQKNISTFAARSADNSAEMKAIARAIANVSADELAKTSRTRKDIDRHFTIETPKQTIHNQLSSGRCWMFAGFNVLRGDFARRYNDSVRVEFSHAYLFFYDQLEKANLMLQTVIDKASIPIDSHEVRLLFRNPIADGGTFCGVADLTAKYGIVPMIAQQETFSAENTSLLTRLVSSKLREYGLELRRMAEVGKRKDALEQRKMEMLSVIYRMLSYGIGEPVKEFNYTFRNNKGEIVIPERKYTPQEFYKFVVGEPLADSFIMVMNDPRLEYHKTYEVEYDRHCYEGTNWKYLNLPVEEAADLAIAQLKAGRKLYSSYDSGKQYDRQSGIADLNTYDYGTLFGTEFPMNKADRITTYDSGSTHAMALVAVDLDDAGKPQKWETENSWGPSSGADGYMIMTNDWWKEYMFRLVIDKEFVPAELLEEYQQEPVMLAPDDPVACADD